MEIKTFNRFMLMRASGAMKVKYSPSRIWRMEADREGGVLLSRDFSSKVEAYEGGVSEASDLLEILR